MRPDYDEQRHTLETDYLQIIQDEFRDGVERGSLHRSLASIVRFYLDDLGFAAFIGQRISGLEDHLSRIEQRGDRKRRVVARAMERAGTETITDPEFSVVRSQTPGSLVLSDEKAIPASFWKPGPPELDRDALLAALRSGLAVPGASLGASEASILVRSR